MLKDLFVSLRPQQWIKNTFIFAALIFAQELFDFHRILISIAAFAAFCLLSSAVYLFNDIHDAEADRQHPVKKNRPIAAGRVGRVTALVLSIVLTIASLYTCFLITRLLFILAIAYLIQNILYTFWLKRMAVLDVMCISAGFVLRAAAGGAAISVEISSWLIICTFFLALFLGLAKRRHELVLLEANSALHRKTLSDYTPYLLDQMISIVTTATLLCYVLYTLSEDVQRKLHAHSLYVTIPFVLYGIYRYLYLIHRNEGSTRSGSGPLAGGSPSATLLADKPLLIDVFLWGLTAAAILYL